MNNELAQAVYDRSPVWMQNLLLSAYGFSLYRARYGGSYRQHLARLLRTERYSRSELAELQAVELRRLLTHAARHVPWYARLFAEHGISPDGIDPDNLGRALPILEKDTVRTRTGLLIADNVAGGALHTINTSGTTGSPLVIRATADALRRNYAFFERFLRTAGVRSRDRSVTFAGRMLLPAGRLEPPYWRSNWAMNTLLCSSYHLSDSTAEAYIRCIARFRPRYIDAYPSAAYTLALYLMERPELPRIRPKAIVTSSETLLEHQRALIEEAFGCPVYDQYGSAELAACITQCEHGSYHVNPEYGIVEIVREDGRPAAPGEAGELICTGFLNDAMPMIRYRIGDSAIASDRSCGCGRAWPVVESLLGRVDDVIVTPDGRRIGRLDPLFKGLTGIKEAQIVQVAPNRLEVNLVRDNAYDPSVGARLVEALSLRVGRDMQIELRFLERIPRTAAGKFRSVVSRLPQPARHGVEAVEQRLYS